MVGGERRRGEHVRHHLLRFLERNLGQAGAFRDDARHHRRLRLRLRDQRVAAEQAKHHRDDDDREGDATRHHDDEAAGEGHATIPPLTAPARIITRRSTFRSPSRR